MKSRLSLFLIANLFLPLAAFAAAIPVYTEQKTSIVATTSQPEFIIKLKSNPTTGYSWFLREYNANYLQPVKHRYQAAENRKLIGASGYELWTFKMKPEAFNVPRQMPLRFVYARPWEKSEESTSLVFWISTTEKNSN